MYIHCSSVCEDARRCTYVHIGARDDLQTGEKTRDECATAVVAAAKKPIDRFARAGVVRRTSLPKPPSTTPYRAIAAGNGCVTYIRVRAWRLCECVCSRTCAPVFGLYILC